jgi:hypothetical protein
MPCVLLVTNAKPKMDFFKKPMPFIMLVVIAKHKLKQNKNL